MGAARGVKAVAGDRHEPPSARLRVPDPQGLTRERLLRLQDGLGEGGLGLVVAPAGCGKTTLLAGWARRFPGPVAWYRARPDDLPERLVDHLAVAVGAPGTGHHDVDDVAIALERGRQPRLLVIDDVHALPDRTSHEVLESLLMEIPASTAVVLGSRRAPDIDLSHAEMPTVPVRLDADDLRFRSWEVESLFRDVYRCPLLPEDAAALARHTEGWAAALHLFHLSTLRSPPDARRRAITELARRNRYARGYLSRQVLSGLGPQLSAFLRRTAVFDTVTALRCDTLLQRSGSQEVLEELVGRQALTTTDDGGTTFRYHEVLRRHLEADLEAELGAAGLRDWYGRAAHLLESDGAVVEAMRVRARAQDWAGVRSLLLTYGHEIAGRAGGWPGLLPVALVREDPWVALAEAHRLLGDGQLAHAESMARHAQRSLDDQRGHDKARDLLDVTRAWQQVAVTPSERWYEVVAAALKELPDAVRHGRSGRAAVTPLAQPFVSLLRGDVRAAEAALPAARREASDRTAACLALDLLAAGLAGMTGRPDAADAAESVAIQSELGHLDWFARAARSVRAASNPDRACRQDELARVADLCQRRGDRWGVALAEVIDAGTRAVDVLSGEPPAADPAAARAALARAASTTATLGAGVLTAWLTALAALLDALSAKDEAREAAVAATSLARSTGAVGAQALGTAALAIAENRAASLRAAESLADDVHLALRPWRRLDRGREPVAARASPMGDEAPSGTRFCLLGSFRIEQRGSPLDLSDIRPQHRLLLRMLALHADTMVHREQLTEVLWPERTSDAALHRLQTAVSALRRLLASATDDGCDLVRDGARYGLMLGSASSTDVVELRRQLAQAHAAQLAGDDTAEIAALRAAVDSYEADLLTDDGYADWVIPDRELLRTQVASAASTLAARLADVDPRATLAAAKRALSIDPFDDEAWRLTIATHTELGDVASAEKARMSYRDVLTDLGVDA